MSTAATPAAATPPFDAQPHATAAQRVLGALPQSLHELNANGYLEAADVHVVSRLVRMCAEPVSELAQLGAALAVRAVRQGSTCLAVHDLADVASTGPKGSGEASGPALPAATDLVAALRSSPLVVGSAGGPLRPLVIADSDDGPLIYLQKYFQQEQVIRSVLAQRAGAPSLPGEIRAAVAAVFADAGEGATRQQLAAAVAASRWTTVLTGGPGTGKTYTVARILAVLARLSPGRLHVAVCAPTGRAVAQLQASLDGMQRELPDTAASTPVHAVTVHGLLGWRPGARPRYGRGNRLPHDVVVVDETSMLSATAMSHLIEAVRPDARLILVGDPHQLASVEAGAVLADLVERQPAGAVLDPEIAGLADAAGIEAAEIPRLADGIVELRRNYRNRGRIAEVAAAVNAGDGDRVVALIESADPAEICLVEPDDPGIRSDVLAWARSLWTAAAVGDAARALAALDSHRVLCAHREGRWGVAGWSNQIAEWIAESSGRIALPTTMAGAQPGVPVLVTANDRQNRVFNGDCGVVVADDTANDGGDGPTEESVTVAFRRSEFSEPYTIPPARLAETMWAYAMTIHRSQGSQFGAVTVVLPPADSPLLTRELLYTAITRAKTSVRIVATAEVLRAAVGRRVHRASGLRSAIVVADPLTGATADAAPQS